MPTTTAYCNIALHNEISSFHNSLIFPFQPINVERYSCHDFYSENISDKMKQPYFANGQPPNTRIPDHDSEPRPDETFFPTILKRKLHHAKRENVCGITRQAGDWVFCILECLAKRTYTCLTQSHRCRYLFIRPKS